MLNTNDLFDFIGIPSAKTADYLASNKITEEEKTKLNLLQRINFNIRQAALDNQSKTEEIINTKTTEEIDDIMEIQQLLEKIGYNISIEVITTPYVPKKALYILKINWEM